MSKGRRSSPSEPVPRSQAFLGVGSNLQPEENVPEALRLLAAAERVTLEKVSTFYRTPALPYPTEAPEGTVASMPGGEAVDPDRHRDPDFLNGVVEVSTELSVGELGALLLSIEERLGRDRSSGKYAPRTMDMDLLLFSRGAGEEGWEPVTVEGGLVHPDVLTRPFVALPLLEIAPRLRLPPDGLPLEGLAAGFEGPGGRPEVALTTFLRSRLARWGAPRPAREHPAH